VDHPVRRFRKPAALLAVVCVYGAVGYALIEHWPLGDGLYMTLITISTVGYGEVHPLTPMGRLFTSTLIVGGVGTMLYAFGIFTEMLAEGHIAQYRRGRRLQRRIDDLRNHFVICGYGRIGTHIVQDLEHEGTPYVVIDNNPEALARLEAEERLHIGGDAASEELLGAAGIQRARGLICAVDSDERAVYITLAARALKPDLYLVARAGRPESIRRLELAGADRVVSPYRMAGHQMAELALRPALVEVMDFLQHAGTPVGVEELLVRPGSPVVGRELGEARLLEPERARLLAVRRKDGDLVVNPDAEFTLAEGDLLIAFGTREQLERTAVLVG
jgi:voltage-gated potassium channel